VSVTSTDPTVADSVRLALPGEAGSIAELQRRAWSGQLPQATADALLADLAVSEMTDAWRLAITRPPQARFRVLVAVAQHRVVGFATTIPSPDPDAEPGQDGQIDEFAIDPPAQRRGHGSRLLNACVDTLRADGFSRATWWVTSTDDVVRAFLSEAGWAPDGGWREIGTDDEAIRVKQIRMHTDISATD
jgi:ribosomal protein S18 acetylase RimI-like enzyme